MFRLTLALTAAIFATLSIWGEPKAPGADVARAAPLDAPLLAAQAETAPIVAREIGAGEAVRIALLSDATPAPRPRALAPEAETLAALADAPVAAQASPSWYVTGTLVNLRGGPSTADPVVAQARLNTRAEPLSDTDAPWIHVRLETGEEAWIFARYLAADPA